MKEKIKAFFKIEERQSTIPTEIVAGITTFLTMSYIIFLQPLILSGDMTQSPTGMDSGAIMVSVCIVAAIGSVLMGLLANYPIALAPGMGENFFFVTCVTLYISKLGIDEGVPWQIALGVVFVSGVIFLLLTVFKVRKMIMNSISESLQYAIGGGIGLFIALLGLKQGGIITIQYNTLMLGDIKSITVLIFSVAFLLTAILHVLKVRGAILIGILTGLFLALYTRSISWQGIVESPPSISPIFMKMDMATTFKFFFKLLPLIIIFTFMDVFDTMGTLFGVGAQANLLKKGKLPEAGKAMTADSLATSIGALFGNSTVTAYIESATGVQYGGRSGLTAIITGLCFLVAIFFSPLVAMVGNYPGGVNPIVGPALVIVGCMMMKNISRIDWDDFSEAIPSFLILLGIPLTYSIADGMTLGFIAYPIIKLAGGKRKEIGWLTYVLGFVLILYLIFVKSGVQG